MVGFDYITILLYVLGIFAISWVTSRRITDQKDMFSAARESPWWVSGLSGFMTMFSAGTFVVWGGIAYRLGIVAVVINTCYGIAALLVGYYVAGRWNRLGVSTPAEYVNLRYGKVGLHLFTWTMMVKRIVGVAASLYALAILLIALIPLSDGNMLQDPDTGMLSFFWAVILFGTIVIVYTMQGGLWAVLMTDVLQFIVLTLVVLMVSALMIADMSGLPQYLESIPDGFLSPVSGGYGWFFLFGWVLIHFFMVGAEWAFVQRFISVRSPKEARKSAYLFGFLYLATPLFWLLPPLLYRGIGPEVNPEQAYILAAQSVLPPGVLGLMFAAMFSATASMVSSQLNVFAGVLTNDFYKAFMNPKASETSLVRVGRFFTVVLGCLLICVALMVPYMGGAEKLIVSINSLLVVPLFAPALWGLFSKRIGIREMVMVTSVSFILGAFIKFGVIGNPWVQQFESLTEIVEYLRVNSKNVEVLIGVILPVAMLFYFEWRISTTSSGWDRVESRRKAMVETMNDSDVQRRFDPMPANIVMYSLAVIGVAMLVLAMVTTSGEVIIGGFAVILLLISASIYLGIRRLKKKFDSAELN